MAETTKGRNGWGAFVSQPQKGSVLTRQAWHWSVEMVACSHVQEAERARCKTRDI